MEENKTSEPTQVAPAIKSLKIKKQIPIVYLILGLTILVLVGLSGYLGYKDIQLQKQISEIKVTETVSPTPIATADPTTDWKIFTNPTNKTLVKYPSAWTISLTTPPADQIAEGNNTNTLNISKDNYKLRIETSSLGGGGIVCKFNDSTNDEVHGPATDQLGTPYELGIFLDKPARRNLNPINSVNQYGTLHQTLDYTFEACLSGNTPGTDGKFQYTSTINSNNLIVYNAYFTPRENISSENLKIMDQILSTFKFTDQVTDTSSWKTYTNSQYNFSFQYPNYLSSKNGVVAGPFTGTNTAIQTFSNPATISQDTDAAFDGFSLYVVTNTQSSSFKEYIGKESSAQQQISGGDGENINLETTNASITVSPNIYLFYVPSRDEKTVAVFSVSKTNESNFVHDFEKILSTFKFTN
ncbi:hypothetical protein BH10PAT1_BH10PAT1_1420 [soil metagenome]